MSRPIYSEHLETLVAVITHLAVYKHPKRTTQGIAKESQLNEQEVKTVLDSFRGIFKKYRATSPSGEALYALHVRHARQSVESDGDPEREPLDPQYLTILLELVSHRAQDEAQYNTGIKAALIGGGIAIAVAVLGAIVSISIAVAD